MNAGYENEELKPFNELEQDFSDLERIGQTTPTIIPFP